jgi:hypothetical protein
MNPSDANSSLATLRQLKEMLDAGTLTPQEFEALKQQLVFGNVASATPPGSEALPAVPETSALQAPLIEESPSPEVASIAGTPDWLATPVPLLVDSPSPSTYSTYTDEVEERRNPLTLVFAIGGGLLLLSIILYLVLGRPTSADEHLTSTSQTAADSAAVAPEVGPQAQQITLAPTAPETIRVAPATPPPVAATVPSGFRTDSVAAPVPTTASAPIAPATPVKAPAAPKTTAPPKAAPAPTASPDSSATAPG